MKNAAILSVALLILTGCNPHTTEISGKYQLPTGLRDCQIYSMSSGGMTNDVVVVRCPNSEMATQQTRSCGKGCSRNMRSITVEGNEIRDSPYEQQ